MCQGIITHRNGIDTKTVSGMLGIFSEGFTPDSYAHVTTATQKEPAQAIENTLIVYLMLII